MISIVANFSEKLPVLFFFLLLSVATDILSCLLETTFSSLRFLFNFTSLQSFFVHDKAAVARSRINNTGVTGHSLPPKNDFEHARGLRNSAYAVNWASVASPTLGCSIEISRDICIGYTIARSGL